MKVIVRIMIYLFIIYLFSYLTTGEVQKIALSNDYNIFKKALGVLASTVLMHPQLRKVVPDLLEFNGIAVMKRP